jgi:SsrA-binding protein
MAKALAKKAAPNGDRLIAQNRRAAHDFELGKSFEAGLVLVGSEARALRDSPADISEAWVEIQRGEAFVRGMRVSPLAHAFLGHEEKRPRKLLLHRAQIEELLGAQERERMTLVVTKLYFKEGRAKLELRVARGKKLFDKRQALRQRDASKEARAAIRNAKSGSARALHESRASAASGRGSGGRGSGGRGRGGDE